MSDNYDDFSDLPTIEVELPNELIADLLKIWVRDNFFEDRLTKYESLVERKEDEEIDVDKHYRAIGETMLGGVEKDVWEQYDRECDTCQDDEDVGCYILERFARVMFKRESYAVFADVAKEVGNDLPEIKKAFGMAAFNDIIVEAISRHAEAMVIEHENKAKMQEGKTAYVTVDDHGTPCFHTKLKHCCGLQGFDPMKGDTCPACDDLKSIETEYYRNR